MSLEVAPIILLWMLYYAGCCEKQPLRQLVDPARRSADGLKERLEFEWADGQGGVIALVNAAAESKPANPLLQKLQADCSTWALGSPPGRESASSIIVCGAQPWEEIAVLSTGDLLVLWK